MEAKRKLREYRYLLGLITKVNYTESENEVFREMLRNNEPLPNGVVQENPGALIDYAVFYTIKEPEMSQEEILEFIQHKQLETLTTIKRCVMFFTVLTVISLIASLLFMPSIM